MDFEDTSQPDEPHWIPLGQNHVRIHEKPKIAVPKKIVEGGIFERIERGTDVSYRGYWSYERTNGWLILGNQALTNSRNRFEEGDSDTTASLYEADTDQADFKYADSYKYRSDNCVQIPDMFLSTPSTDDDGTQSTQGNIEATLGTTEQVVPEHLQIREGELRHFMTWSEWLHNDPKVVVLFRTDQLPFLEPDDMDGDVGNAPGPKFGGDETGMEPPDIGLSN